MGKSIPSWRNEWCVYRVTCLPNGKLYIGKTGFRYRWSQHKSFARHGSHTLLHRAIRKYGEDRFTYEVIERCRDERHAFERERFWIAELGTKVPYGYNLSDGGEGQSGFKQPESSKPLMARPGPLNGMYGRTHTPEVRKRLAEANRAYLATAGHPWSGRRHSEESRAKMSAGHKGHKSGVGRVFPQETRDKNAAANTGKAPWQRTRNPMRQFLPKGGTTPYMRLWRAARRDDDLSDRFPCVDPNEYEEDRHDW